MERTGIDRAGNRSGRGGGRAPAGLLLLAVLSCGPPSGPAARLDPAAFGAGRYQYPQAAWAEVERPGEWGWSAAGLARAREYFDGLDSAAVMVVHRGVPVAAWGDVAARYNGQSIRKAMLGALLGQEVEAGRLRLDATLAELGIDDSSNPLTPEERQARVVDLLQARGAVYLPAIYEAPSWKRRKPERGSHAPGEAWFYSNWGFNALGTLFERVSGGTIEGEFQRRVADPIGMEDFRPRDVHYLTRNSLTERIQKNDSEHRAYVFMVSARDLARFGLLYLSGGRWAGEQVAPANWVERSLFDHVATHEALGGDRWGYLWWVSPADSALGRAVGHAVYKATGGRGHKVVLVPDLDLVVVHRLATGGVGLASQLRRRFFGAPSVNDGEFNELMRRIVAAHPGGRSRPAGARGGP